MRGWGKTGRDLVDIGLRKRRRREMEKIKQTKAKQNKKMIWQCNYLLKV
jgi:hypothetical protein